MADSNPGERRAIRFYFSFRSPYAWLAAERLESELGGLGVPIERLPIFPKDSEPPCAAARRARGFCASASVPQSGYAPMSSPAAARSMRSS